mmetsp:Transcript_69825/g.145607  ORF Transcript_69825/g.145607 Transcript_69825/m.145607 type:complete len:213 (-) Transcript_69825:83-721(-)
MELNVHGMTRGQCINNFLMLQLPILVHVKHFKCCLAELSFILFVACQFIPGMLGNFLHLFVRFLFDIHAREILVHLAGDLLFKQAKPFKVVEITTHIVLKKHLTLIRFKKPLSILVIMLERIDRVSGQTLLHFLLAFLNVLPRLSQCTIVPSKHNTFHFIIGFFCGLLQLREVLVEVRMLAEKISNWFDKTADFISHCCYRRDAKRRERSGS